MVHVELMILLKWFNDLMMFVFRMQLSKRNFLNLQITKCCIDAFEVLNILLGDNCMELKWSVRSAFSWIRFESQFTECTIHLILC